MRARREHMVRLRRRLEESYERELAARSNHPILREYEPDRPWNSVMSAVMEDTKWWDRELERPALILLANPQARLGDVLGSDARISSSVPSPSPAGLDQQLTSDPSLQTYGGGREQQYDRRRPPPAATATRQAKKQKLKVHNFDSESGYGTNRQKVALCPEFQKGNCRGSGPNRRCPNNPGLTHQCVKCLGDHPAVHCEHEKPVQPWWAPVGGQSSGAAGVGAGKGGGGYYRNFQKGYGKGYKGKGKSKGWYQG